MKRVGSVLRVASLLAVVAVLVSCGAAYAAWPTERVTVIWHSSAGSGGDLFFRALSKAIETETKVPFIVENVTGASGANAWTRAARSPADGSVLLGVSSTFVASPVQNAMPVNYQSFDPVARLFIDAVCLYVAADSPYQTFADFVAAAKERPGELTFVGGTAGSLEAVAARRIMREAQIDVPMVPFEGGGEGAVAIIGGHVTAGVGEYGEIAAPFEGGKLRILATFNKLTGKDVPTFGELGYKTTLEKFRGIVVPKGMPQQTKDEIVARVKVALEDPEFKEYCVRNSLVPAFDLADDFFKVMEVQTEDVKSALAEGN